MAHLQSQWHAAKKIITLIFGFVNIQMAEKPRFYAEFCRRCIFVFLRMQLCRLFVIMYKVCAAFL